MKKTKSYILAFKCYALHSTLLLVNYSCQLSLEDSKSKIPRSFKEYGPERFPTRSIITIRQHENHNQKVLINLFFFLQTVSFSNTYIVAILILLPSPSIASLVEHLSAPQDGEKVVATN